MAVTLGTSPAPVYGDTNAQTSLVTASFTPPSGAIVVAKVLSADGEQTHTGVTGMTFTSRGNVGTTGATVRASLWTAVGAGSAVTVTAAFGAVSLPRSLCVEVWTGAQLAGSPAVHTKLAGSGAPTDTITTVAANSVVSWFCGDWSQKTGTRTYSPAATEVQYKTLTGQYTEETAYQAAASSGSQTYGLSAPGAQSYTMIAIEIQDSGGGPPPAIPMLVTPPMRR